MASHERAQIPGSYYETVPFHVDGPEKVTLLRKISAELEYIRRRAQQALAEKMIGEIQSERQRGASNSKLDEKLAKAARQLARLSDYGERPEFTELAGHLEFCNWLMYRISELERGLDTDMDTLQAELQELNSRIGRLHDCLLGAGLGVDDLKTKP
ncbi:hypothetical protein EOL96_07350 [Candidatus Saccharibacteria bacterium]|nr:hypothetical protein [Candidatus Saccharibacteria bacterium]